jgi:hypothetical protein
VLNVAGRPTSDGYGAIGRTISTFSGLEMKKAPETRNQSIDVKRNCRSQSKPDASEEYGIRCGAIVTPFPSQAAGVGRILRDDA